MGDLDKLVAVELAERFAIDIDTLLEALSRTLKKHGLYLEFEREAGEP